MFKFLGSVPSTEREREREGGKEGKKGRSTYIHTKNCGCALFLKSSLRHRNVKHDKIAANHRNVNLMILSGPQT
jgi:hypothetical protein